MTVSFFLLGGGGGGGRGCAPLGQASYGSGTSLGFGAFRVFRGTAVSTVFQNRGFLWLQERRCRVYMN